MTPPIDRDPREPAADARDTLEPEAALAGWDPYIVAITGGGPEARDPVDSADAGPPVQSRKVGLVAWLRAHGA